MNKTIQLFLDETGNILIPAAVRQHLSLDPGMTLVVEPAEEGGLRLRVHSRPPLLVDKNGILVARVQALSNLSNLVRQERDRRVFTLLQRTGL